MSSPLGLSRSVKSVVREGVDIMTEGVYPQSDRNLPMAFDESISMNLRGPLFCGYTSLLR